MFLIQYGALFTNNVLNEEQIKQIEEIGSKPASCPLFDNSKFFNKTDNNLFRINNGSILDKITNGNNYRSEIKFFNEIPQPKINFNINSPEPNNILNNNSINIFNNYNHSIDDKKNKLISNNNNLTNISPINMNNINNLNNLNNLNNVNNLNNLNNLNNINNVNNINNNNINNEKLNNNSLNLSLLPSIIDGNKENINKSVDIGNNIINNDNNNIINNNINKEINDLNIINDNMSIKTNNNSNKVENFLIQKEPPMIINNPNNNFLNDYREAINRIIFPGLNQYPLYYSLNNNYLYNNIKNTFGNTAKYFPFNLSESNNLFSVDKCENNFIENNDNNLIGKKRF